MTTAIDIKDLEFNWGHGEATLRIPALAIARGERVFLQGPSGSGKSTLLGVIAGVLAARQGQVQVLGADFTALSGAERDAFRADHIGLVFQMFNLLPWLSVQDNVLLSTRFSTPRRLRCQPDPASEARRLLGELGLSGLLTRPVTELSIGQQQRVAVARALAGRPALIIADEPTSALDSDARDAFLQLLMMECAAAGSALLFVSHDLALGRHFDRRIAMADLNLANAVPA